MFVQDSEDEHTDDVSFSPSENTSPNGIDSESPTTDSESSTPIKRGPFKPLFVVRVPSAVKNGDSLQFTISVSKNDKELEDVVREYDDLEWLQHCLMTGDGVVGCIIPPLPPRPEYDAKAAESKSKKQLGSETNIIMADEFHKDCRNVEKYLRMVTSHEVFGTSEFLTKFLCEKEAAVKAKLKRGLLMRMSSAVDSVRKGQHKDIDEYFQTQRDWATKYSSAMKETSTNFNKLMYTQLRLANCYGHLSTALTDYVPYKDKTQDKINKLQLKLSEGLDNAKHGLEVLSTNDEKTLAFHLDLYSRYMESVKEMLFRRTCLLVSYEDANKAYEKAKPNKKETAEQAKISTEKCFEDCTENGRRELKSFMQHRLLAFEDSLSSFAEAQIKTARDTYTLLVRTLASVKQLDL